MVEKEGKYPCNARVDVDYTGKKPKVNFSYPDKNPKKDAEKQGGNIFVLLFLMIILLAIPYAIFVTDSEYNEYPSNCSIEWDNHTKNVTYNYKKYEDGRLSNSSFNYSYSKNWVEGFNITCQNETFVYYYNQYETHDYESVFHYTDNEIFDERTKINIGFIAYFILMYFFIILFLNRRVTRLLIKFKWYRRWIPKHNAEGTIFKKRKRYYKKFKPNDVFENIVIIPQFGNIVLDYKTKGDFKNKLRKIRIREYNWKNKNRKGISKNKQDKFKWYAIFSFSDKPKNGYLEVEYK